MVNPIRGAMSLLQVADDGDDEKSSRGWWERKSRRAKEEDEDEEEYLEEEEGLSPAAKDVLRNFDDDKRIKELSSNFYDIQGKLKNVEMNNKGLSADIGNMRSDLEEVNLTMRKLLCIYEVITKSTNPFVTGGSEFGTLSDIEAARAEAIEHEGPEDASSLAASELLMFSSLFQAVRKIENHMEAIFKDRMVGGTGEEGDLAGLESWYMEFKKLLEMHRFHPRRERLTAVFDEGGKEKDEAEISISVSKGDEAAAAPAGDLNRLLTSIRICEHYLEKIVVQKIQGKDPSVSELEKLDYWYQEFVGWR